VAAYSTSISSDDTGGQPLFLLQLFLTSARRNDAASTTGDAAAAQKQKLDCALQLARSVALDFNNALTSVLGHTSLLLTKAEPDHPWRRSLLEVEKAAGRAAEIANDLAAFSRQEKDVRGQPVGNLNPLLGRCVETLRQSLKEPVAWKLQLERRLLAAKFDEAKIQQAFLKILENALEARGPDAAIIVSTRNVELTEATQDRNLKLAAGTYVCAEISDNGRGIEPEVLPRIFEPFFTTKKAPHRGLGLAWVYGIVTNHGGGVAVSSAPGDGAAVRVYLPAEKSVAPGGADLTDDLNGSGTILMVDDEDLLLTMGEMILSSYGYTVFTANSGPKALVILAQCEKPVDLVITDLVMPVMSGRELVERVRQVSPATQILCTSGYVQPATQPESAAYLQKPFTSTELLLKVKAALG
jgi:signal transduction histidine kinase/CheY-like chemotaxis protein